MNFAMVGCGAMGSLFGALLARAGHKVWMIDNHPERAKLVAANGIRVESSEGAFHARVNVAASPEEMPAPHFVFIFVKAHDTTSAAQAAAAVAGSESTIVTLQNGLGNVTTLVRHFGAARVIGGTTAHGATEIAPGHVRHAGTGPTVIAAASGEREVRVEALADALREAGFETAITDDLDSAIWSKLVANCGLNAVAALTRLPNGAVGNDPGAMEVVRAAANEAAAVARAKGITLAYSDVEGYVQEVCNATAENVNSMLQDVVRGRRTEVEAINGAVVEEGRTLNVDTPVNAALAALVAAVERNYQHQVRADRRYA